MPSLLSFHEKTLRMKVETSHNFFFSTSVIQFEHHRLVRYIFRQFDQISVRI